MKIAIVILIYLIFIGLSIGITGLLVKVICWAFSLTFTWKLAVGIWALMAMANWAFRSSREG